MQVAGARLASAQPSAPALLPWDPVQLQHIWVSQHHQQHSPDMQGPVQQGPLWGLAQTADFK